MWCVNKISASRRELNSHEAAKPRASFAAITISATVGNQNSIPTHSAVLLCLRSNHVRVAHTGSCGLLVGRSTDHLKVRRQSVGTQAFALNTPASPALLSGGFKPRHCLATRGHQPPQTVGRTRPVGGLKTRTGIQRGSVPPNPSVKRSANGMAHWPSSAGASPHFALAVQRAMPLAPAYLKR
jgi:hypothetical protein